MKVTVQKCTSKCNKKYCNFKSVCRPHSPTSKLVSVDINFHPGITIEAPIIVKDGKKADAIHPKANKNFTDEG